MAGEINGNLFLIYKGTSGSEKLLAGQGEGTMNVGGEPIAINNKSSAWRTMLTGSTTTKSIDFDLTVTFSSDTVYAEVMADAETAKESDYTIKLGDVVSWAGKFVPNVQSHSAPIDKEVETSIQFMSNGEIKRTVTP